VIWAPTGQVRGVTKPRIHLVALLPSLLLSAVVTVAVSPAPVSSIHDEPPVQMEVTPTR
jgi:hypothetical protein